MPQPADPLRDLFNALNPTTVPFGPSPDAAVQLVESFNEYEAEYAAVRKSVGIFARPDRAALQLVGGDARDFLHRMLSNDIQSLKPGQLARAFFLGRDGRIHGDVLCLVEDGGATLVTDVFTATSLAEELEQFIFADDVEIADTAADGYEIQLLGPNAPPLLSAAAGAADELPGPFSHRILTIDGQPCTVYRSDTAATATFHLVTPRAAAAGIYEKLVGLVGGMVPDTDPDAERQIPGRPIGWAAYNTLRIESGVAVFQVDFARDSLPAETGADTLGQAVSFNKGCYPGQEIVARMQSRGQVKKSIVGLKFGTGRLPLAGNEVYNPDDNTIIGAVTSSAISPMLGEQAIALAVMSSDFCEAGTQVKVAAEGSLVDGQVVELPFVR